MNSHTFEVLEYPRVVELVVERCVTTLGRTRAERMIPHGTYEASREEQARLSEMLGLLERTGRLSFQEIKDPSAILGHAAVDGAALETREFLDLLRIARTADDVGAFFSKRKEEAPKQSARAGRLDPLTGIQMEIARCIDEEGIVTDRASSELKAIRREIDTVRNEVRKILEQRIHSRAAEKILQESIITLRNGRYVIPVKEGEKRSVEGIVHDHSGSGATIFIEPMETVEKNNRLARLNREEAREIRRILKELTDRVRENASAFALNAETLGEFDFDQARALLSKGNGSCIPALRKEGETRIVQGRHPLLEKSMRAEGKGKSLVPLDLAFPDGCSTIVLTGPNTGGKTVALKTLGLFVLMAQSGLGVPAADGTSLRFFEKVYADIGDEQSIENSLSSFSARLRRIVAILKSVGKTSLVLLDEIGSGTDPAEGSALSMAVLEEIHNRGASSLTTTHLGSLKVFVHETAGMENASMEFDSERMCPTYRLEVGLPGTSHALEIAERLGLSSRIVESARSRVGESKTEIDALLNDLKERKKMLLENEREIAGKRERLDAKAVHLRERENTLLDEEKRRKRESIEEANRYLEESRAMVERVVRELRSDGGGKESVRGARRLIDAEISRLREEKSGVGELSTEEAALSSVESGQTVLVKTLDRTGMVVGEGNRKGMVFVESGGIRLEVAIGDLAAASEEPSRKKAIPRTNLPERTETRREIDLRGLTVEEAVIVVDKFLDDAVLSGLLQVRIIHGIGTGALRSEVTRILGKDPRVEKYRLGGNGGFSVVEMKN